MLGRPPLPKEHGSWVMFLAAFLAGALVAGVWSWALPLFLMAGMSAFMLRRPATILVRGEARTPEARAQTRAWLLLEAMVAVAAGIPLLAVFHLWPLIPVGLGAALLLLTDVVRATQSARQTFSVEVIGSLGIALLAPGAYCAATGRMDATAFALWAVLSLQFLASVFFLRVKVRWVRRPPTDWRVRLETGWENLLYQGTMVALAGTCSALGLLPRYAWAPLALTAVRRLLGTLFGQKDTDFKRMGRNESLYALFFVLLVALVFRLG